MSHPPTWSFSAQIERFDVDAAWHFLAIPAEHVDAVREAGDGRYVITVNDAVTWHCGLLPTGDGRWFVAVSKAKIKAAQTTFGGWVHVDLAVDKSKYGMPIPDDLQDMLDDDPEFLKRFDAMLPGKRRGMIHHIASAKTDATVAKRILKLMQELGLVWALLGWCLSAQAQTLGHARTADYIPLLEDRAVAVVANHTSMVGGPDGTHLVDTLLSLGVEVKHVFAPEHGFRGDAANGAHIEDGTDAATGLAIFSLHGSNRKPQPSQLNGIDVVVFDIQDVGARFYTYVSTLMLVMEACAEAGVDVMVLDRPNPHGHHMAGPMLDPDFKSFVGWIPTPMVHGLTLGELANMAVAEAWFPAPEGWKPTVVTCQGWDHGADYALPIPPSPNLPTAASIDLYPSLCLFEPTDVSVGRGTSTPFELLGHPNCPWGSYRFTPVPTPGAAPHPKHENTACSGQRLTGLAQSWRTRSENGLPRFTLAPLWTWADMWRTMHQRSLDGFIVSPSFFDKLAGTDEVRLALENQRPLDPLIEAWAVDHAAFFKRAEPHLLYPWNAPKPGR